MVEWILLLVGGWLAATISGAAGFGGALLLLPVLTYVVGAKAAVPILTLAQLLGNLSRAGFRWVPVGRRWQCRSTRSGDLPQPGPAKGCLRRNRGRDGNPHARDQDDRLRSLCGDR